MAQNRIWLDCRDRILSFDFDAREHDALVPPLREDEEIGQFIVGEDVGVSLYRDGYQVPGEDTPDLDLSPRVMRLDRNGNVRWQADLPVEALAFGGVVSASADTNWRTEPKRAWRPRSWKSDCYVNDGLLLSGDVLLASYIEISSGIGFSYALRWSDGTLLWTSEMCPFSRRGIYGVGSFVFSVGGYGDRRTFVLNERGKKVQEWNVSGAFCVALENIIWVSGESNLVGEQHHCWKLHADAVAEKGTTLSLTEGSQPALSEDGLIFWRAGQLLRIDSNGRAHVLNPTVGDANCRVLSRMMLDEQGTLIFSTAGSGAAHEGNIQSYLWIAREKVAPLAQTSWPCGDGNPQANPVWREGS